MSPVRLRCHDAFTNCTAVSFGQMSRTLHTATDAIDTKWIAQQWIACGCGEATGSSKAPVASPYPGRWEEVSDGSRARKSRKQVKGRAGKSTGRGFGR